MAEGRRSLKIAKEKTEQEIKAKEYIPLEMKDSTEEVIIPGFGGNVVEERRGTKRRFDDEDVDMKEEPSLTEKDESEEQACEQMQSESSLERKRHSRRPRKKRRFCDKFLLHEKNPLMLLNELKPGLEYTFLSQDGPSHAPVFAMSVTVNDETFEGRGPSKQKAKQDAATRALKTFVQPNRLGGVEFLGGTLEDFTSDSAESLMNPFGKENENGTTEKQKDSTEKATPAADAQNPKPPCPLIDGKHPVMLLNERYSQNVEYEIVDERGLPHVKYFTCKVSVNGKEFFGIGRNKRMAKSRAAEEALLGLEGLRVSFGNPSDVIQQSPYKPEEQINQPTADHIGAIIIEKFNSLKSGLPNNIRRKVLAGIVMTENINNELKFTVVGLGTGTKCIGGEYMSDRGLAVNDCHGEIISRRCLLRFLYSQLSKCINGDEKTCFQKKDEGTPYGLKEHINFHLFVSTSPCGDARVFSPHEQEVGETDHHPMRRSRGLLRTKIEIGEGTIPVQSDPSIQTWDGVLQGERLRTMSCSDKIAKWNVVGIQGALLSKFIGPIYLKSIILGSLYHGHHLARAVTQRLGSIEGLPPSYKHNFPGLSGISNPEMRAPGKAPNISLNWTIEDNGFEIINSTTGKVDMKMSRLSKQSLYKDFLPLWKKLVSEQEPQSYWDAKMAAADYQMAKQILVKKFEKQGLGQWVKKPMEQDMFGLIIQQS